VTCGEGIGHYRPNQCFIESIKVGSIKGSSCVVVRRTIGQLSRLLLGKSAVQNLGCGPKKMKKKVKKERTKKKL